MNSSDPKSSIMPENSATCLRTLSNLLSGRSRKVFPNQVVFYHAVFAATNPQFLPEDCLEPMDRISAGGRRDGDEEIVRRVNYLLRSGLDSNSANVGKHINNAPEMPIPRQHRAHYLREENRADIIRRLQAVIRFCLAFHPEPYRLGESDFRELLAQLKQEFSGLSPALARVRKLTAAELGEVIYEVLSAYLLGLQKAEEARVEEPPRGAAASARQREYAGTAEMYEAGSTERYFALLRLAGKNADACYELGRIYARGGEFCGNGEDGQDGVLRIAADAERAAEWYRRAAQADPPVAGACYALGEMIRRGLTEGIPAGERDAKARGYFSLAAQQDYPPAWDGLGEMELEEGDRLRERLEARRENGGEPDRAEWEEVLAHYRKGLLLCDRAGCAGWAPGHIHVAGFLENPRCRDEVWPILRESTELIGPADGERRWRLAAALGNMRAVRRLALLEP